MARGEDAFADGSFHDHSLREVLLLEACRDRLPPSFVAKSTADELRRAGKIVHVRFDDKQQ